MRSTSTSVAEHGFRGGRLHPADNLAQRGAEAGTDLSYGSPQRAGKDPCGDSGTATRATGRTDGSAGLPEKRGRAGRLASNTVRRGRATAPCAAGKVLARCHREGPNGGP